MMQANRDPMTGAWRWMETLGVPMAEVPEPLYSDLMKLRRIYPEVEQMVSHPVSMGGSRAARDADA